MAQVAVCSQINTKHKNIVWAEHTILEMLNLLVHLVTSELYKVNIPLKLLNVQSTIGSQFPTFLPPTYGLTLTSLKTFNTGLILI